jgi:putative flippase GtrA
MSIKPHPVLIDSYYRLIGYDKIRFLAVGAGGFLVNYGMLALLYDLLGAPILIAQIIGAETALLATFVGNNFWAFVGHHHISIKKKLIKFHASALAGLAINSAFVVVLVHYAHLYYGLALVIGSAAGLIWNYTMYKRFVFTHHLKTGKSDILD